MFAARPKILLGILLAEARLRDCEERLHTILWLLLALIFRFIFEGLYGCQANNIADGIADALDRDEEGDTRSQP